MDLATYEQDARRAIADMIVSPTPPRLYAICTGVCAGLQRTLWSVPGVSAVLVGAQFPYAGEATAEVLGFTPASYVCAETAMALAHAAYMRALASPRAGMAIGLGVTGSVASVRAHRGEHRAFMAVVTSKGTILRSVGLPKDVGADARMADDRVIEAAAFHAMLDAQLGEFQDPEGAEAISRKVFFDRPLFRADGTREAPPKTVDALLLYPGAFDPLHEGHRGLAFEAARVSGRRVVFHITAVTPHKTALSTPVLLARARGLRGHDVLFGFDDALYIEKARRYPGAGIVIGADALVRMLDPKWGPDIDSMLREFTHLGTKFYVANRADRFGELINWTAHALATGFGDLFVPVPGRWDVSSTQLREKKM